MFELKKKDACGRIGILEIMNRKITTPTLMPVINPNKMIITPKEMKEEFRVQMIITNSFIIENNNEIKKQILKKKLHKFLEWDGPIYTDSGVFQSYSQGIKDIDPKRIIDFQKKIESDIITPVDVFTFPDDNKKVAEKKLIETIKRIKEARKTVKFLNAPIQGGMYLDLRKKAAQNVSKINPDIFSIGGIVPLMEQYRFTELCDIILTCKENLDISKPVHAFGAGHPAVLALLTAFGCDLFDSAMYAIAAKEGRYLTNLGTYRLNELEEFPCSCPVCSKYTVKEVRESHEVTKLLARHNLYATFQEIRTIRQAILDNSLWELVQNRCRSHPELLKSLIFNLKKHKDFILSQDLFTKKSALNVSGIETNYRPEVTRAKELIKNVKSIKKIIKEPFGKIPIELSSILYPLSQSINLEDEKINNKGIKPEAAIKAILSYQFGVKNFSKFNNLNIEISKKTNRIRRIYQNKELLGTIRPNDGLFIPSFKGAQLLGNNIKKVYVKNKDVENIVLNGGNVFCKFVWKTKPFIYAGEEITIVNKNGKLLRTGTAMVNSLEMSCFKRGTAVKTR